MSSKNKFWKRSPVYRNQRRIKNLWAFRKWKRENGSLSAEIEERFAFENQIQHES